VTRRIVLRLSVSAQEEADDLQAMLQDETDRAVLDVPGLRAVPPPVVHVDTEAPDRLRATVVCTLEWLIHADGAQRELAKRLRARLRTARVDPHRGALSWGLAWRQPTGEFRGDSELHAG
jgi:hypothetical protein